MKNIKAIIFDAYGTLFDVNSAAEKCKNNIGEKWEGFANYWRTTQLEYTWLRSLMDRHKDFWQVTEDSLDKSMKVFDIDPEMKNELLNLYKKLSTFNEVPNVLKNLKNNLDQNTIIMPGHNYSIKRQSTIGEEITGNPFFSFDNLKDFVQYRMHDHDKTRQEPYAPITHG